MQAIVSCYVLNMCLLTVSCVFYSCRYDDVVLVIIGSTRNHDDKELQLRLVREAARLDLADHVRFEVNQPYRVLCEYMQSGAVGLHTMWNEHFGISVVEMMAAGLVVVAHNSGGPKMDIVVPPAADWATFTESSGRARALLLDDTCTGLFSTN